jgi:hypothetical protein
MTNQRGSHQGGHREQGDSGRGDFTTEDTESTEKRKEEKK